MGRRRKLMKKMAPELDDLARQEAPSLPFSDPYNCLLCREQDSLCRLHLSMANDTEYKPSKGPKAYFNNNLPMREGDDE